MTTKKEIIKKLVKELSKNENIKSIIQIGSSLWDKKSKDIDIIIFVKGDSPSYNDLEFISKIKKDFIKKFNITFGMGGLQKDLNDLNIDLIIIPRDYKIFYSFNPLLIYGMSLNEYKLHYGKDFFKDIRKKIKPSKEMLFKFGGPLSNFYFLFLLNFDNLKPENSKMILSNLKMILYPFVFIKKDFVKKKEIIPFLKKKYSFFKELCDKYEIKENIFYKEKLTQKKIKNIYCFLQDLIKKLT